MPTLTASIHQADIQSALACCKTAQPEPTAHAAQALRVLLQNIYDEPDATIAWKTSSLTGDGFPVEFAFTTADNSLRYTCEVSTPLTTPKERLAIALRRLKTLGSAAPPAPLLAKLQQIQESGTSLLSLQYGTWVSGRHSLAGDSYKLYVEVPDGALKTAAQPLNRLRIPQPELANRTVQLRMLGYNLATRQLEPYFKVQRLEAYHLPRLMAPCGLSDHAHTLHRYLEQQYGYALPDKLPGDSVGFSYSLSPVGVPETFTLFFSARAFWGGDASIRRRFCQSATAQGWDASLYTDMTSPLKTCHTWATHHGLLGYSVLPCGSILPGIGVRPLVLEWAKTG